MTGPIEIFQRPEEATRAPENSCYWVAETNIGGEHYTARSRHGAPHELARLLAGAGISDAPVIVRCFGLAGYASYRSLHAMAQSTFTEGAATPVTRRRWTDRTLRWEGVRKGDGNPVLGQESVGQAEQDPPAAASL